ncbi:MAG: hypothetical protein AAFX93_20130 [Verrucomicrobiota bacterium]
MKTTPTKFTISFAIIAFLILAASFIAILKHFEKMGSVIATDFTQPPTSNQNKPKNQPTFTAERTRIATAISNEPDTSANHDDILDYLRGELGIPKSLWSERIQELTLLFNSGNYQAVEDFVSNWADEDLLGALNGLALIRGYEHYFNVDIPYDVFMDKLRKHPLEEQIDLLTRVGLTETYINTLAQMALAESWKSSPETFSIWLRDAPSMNNPIAFDAVFREAAESGNTFKLAETFLALPSEDSRGQFFTALTLEELLHTDPDKVAAYVNSREQEPRLDLTVGQLATIYSSSDPIIALDWANSISDPAHRDDTVFNVLAIWDDQGQHRKEVEQWLNENSGFSPNRVSEILHYLNY